MYKWFGDNTSTYEQFYTIESCILLFQRSFLTTLLMKGWVTCALDESCMAPPGSRLWPCCGCHRYDQNALTVVSSFFYGYPKEVNSTNPAVAFPKSQFYFYAIRRREEKSYFTPKPKLYYSIFKSFKTIN